MIGSGYDAAVDVTAPAAYRSATVVVAAALVLAACEGGRVEERGVVLALSEATSCRPLGTLPSVTVRALGDAPQSPEGVLTLDPTRPALTLPTLPYEVRALGAEARAGSWWGVGYAPLAETFDPTADRAVLLLLPPGLSCALADPEARATDGAALATRGERGIAIVGGLDAERASGRVALLAPGAQLTTRAMLDLASPAAFATATGLPDGTLLVAGGALSHDAQAFDSLEVLDPSADESALRAIGRLASPRRDHSAILLRDGAVLLVGGRTSGGGASQDTLELVDVAARRGSAIDARLAHPRSAPTLALDASGRVWIAGGADDGSSSLERFDPDTGSLEGFELPVDAPDLVLALAGERLLWIAGRRASVVTLGDEPTVAQLQIELPWAPVRGVATSGRVLIVDAEQRVALVDPGLGSVEERGVGRGETALARLVDGSIVELAREGGALRREDEPSTLDDPPVSLSPVLDPRGWLLDPTDPPDAAAWDGASWRREGAEIVALRPGARADVVGLRASRAELGVRARGPIEIVMEPEAGGRVVVLVEAGGAAVGDCRLEAPLEHAIVEPGAVTLAGASERVRCATGHDGLVAFALRAPDEGTYVQELTIARR